MHEPSDDKVLGFLAQRQDAQKKEQRENPDHAYEFEHKEDLSPDKQTYLETMKSEDFLKNFMHEGDRKSVV